MDKTNLAKLRHDLRTPINHILGYGELLEEDLHDQGIKDLGDLEKIKGAARRLLLIIEESLVDHAPAPLDHHDAPYFPVDQSPAVPHEPAADAPVAVTGRILVVDDNEENRDVLAKRLERQGHRTEQAGDGHEALALLQDGVFDLVLLDMIMPGLDGYSTLCRLKTDEKLRHIPVIMISALDEIDSVVRCIEEGAEDYLPKPFNPIVLRARIGASLEKKMLRDHEQAALRRIEETQQRLQSELDEAAKYVVSILPEPMSSPFRISWAYDPSSELAGDSFGYHWLDDTHFAIYLLDVCGHGVGAALLSVAAINVIRSGSMPKVNFHDPADVLRGLNETFQMERHNNMYFTIWYGVYETTSRQLVHASGGHPPAFLLHANEEGKDIIDPLRCPGMLIGAMPDVTFKCDQITVPPDSRLFVFCDGAYEIKRHDEDSMIDFDEDFTAYVLHHGRSPSLPDDVLKWIRSIHRKPTLDDDYSFVAIDFPA